MIFAIQDVYQWLYKEQKNGTVTGTVIHEYLQKHRMIKDCLGISDLIEIRKKGPKFFNEHFGNNCVFAWKSLSRNRHDHLWAPCLWKSIKDGTLTGEEVVNLSMTSIVHTFHSRYTALRFK
jgi:hypothetical protein